MGRLLLAAPSWIGPACRRDQQSRAGLAVEAMRRGKDFLVDKPGFTSFAPVCPVEQVQRETGRIVSVDFHRAIMEASQTFAPLPLNPEHG